MRQQVYSSESIVLNPAVLTREMIADIAASRELAWRLFVRNISTQYRQSLLGYVWAFVPPLLSMAVWVFLNSQKVIKIDDPGMPYPLFVLTGTVLWQTFVDALNSPQGMVNESKPILAKVNFPREALVVAGFLQVGFNFVIRFSLLIAAFIWFDIPFTTMILVGCASVLNLIALGIGLGMLLTPLGVLYADVGRLVGVVTQFWFFLTPIIYPMPKAGFAAIIVEYNPVTPVLVAIRELLVLGQTAEWAGFWLVGLVSIFLLTLGWLFMRVSMPHLISRIGA